MTDIVLVLATVPADDRGETIALRELHSYELAELVVVPVAEGSAACLDWVSERAR